MPGRHGGHGRTLAKLAACAALISGGASFPSIAGASHPPFRAQVSLLSTAGYGTVLVVGNGRLKGFPLYIFSGDADGVLRCGTTVAHGYDLGPVATTALSCTGPESDLLAGVKSDDWPAFTSAGQPQAGSGVNARLLRTVTRAGIGRQVTYAGHPLYLFDPASEPFSPQGENLVETVHPLAPWHGYWSLISPAGTPAPGRTRLARGKLPSGAAVLSVVMDENVMPFDETVYAYSNSPRATRCTGACALTWVPVLSHSDPLAGPGVNAQLVSTRRLANGTEQVTYGGRPLFLYSKEKVSLTSSIRINSSGTTGNGAGAPAPGGGTFVTIPLS
jgi:predicted lipoprotein with Yx(FWY)xxD motif